MSAVRIASSAIGPLTAITAVLLFTGWVRTRTYFGYFGVDSGSMGFGPQDYMLRSGDLGAGAVLVLAFLMGVALVVDRTLVWALARLNANSSLRRRIERGVALGGAVLSLGGMFGVVGAVVTVSPPALYNVGIIALGALIILRFGIQRGAVPDMLGGATAMFGLLILALAGFWALDRYASDIGTEGAAQVDHGIARLPVVTILTTDQLDLPGSYVSVNRVRQFDNQWAYRYTGARLLQQANDKWFLITSPPSGGYRSTVEILRDSDSIRVQTVEPE